MGNQGEAQQLAQRIETARTNAGYSILQLAAESGIANSTLHRKLTHTPEAFTIRDVTAIAFVLGTTLDTFFVRTP